MHRASAAAEKNQTQDFINLLRFYSTEKCFIDKDSLDLIAASDEPIAPPIERGVASAIEVHVVTKFFDKSLGRRLDWQAIRSEAARLSARQVEVIRLRREVEDLTAFLPIANLNGHPLHTFAYAWCRAWNSRNLEMLVELFRKDGIYTDVSFRREAVGQIELRRLFGEIFHTRKMTLNILEAAAASSTDYHVLSWTRKGALVQPASTPDMEFRGRSLVELRGGRLWQCVEVWNNEDLGELDNRDVVFE